MWGWFYPRGLRPQALGPIRPGPERGGESAYIQGPRRGVWGAEPPQDIPSPRDRRDFGRSLFPLVNNESSARGQKDVVKDDL